MKVCKRRLRLHHSWQDWCHIWCKFYANSRSTLPPTNHRSGKHATIGTEAPIWWPWFFLKQPKTPGKLMPRFEVLDLVMLKTFQFRGQATDKQPGCPGVQFQVVERPPRHTCLGQYPILICWTCDIGQQGAKRIDQHLQLCVGNLVTMIWRSSFWRFYLGTLWCTDTVSLYTNSGPSTWTIMFAIQTCFGNLNWKEYDQSRSIKRFVIQIPCFLFIRIQVRSHQNPLWFFFI